MKVLKFWILRPKPHIVCDFRWPLTRPQNLGESKSKGLRWAADTNGQFGIIRIMIESVDSFCAIRSFSVRSSHIYLPSPKGERCAPASSTAKSDGCWSRSCQGGAGQGEHRHGRHGHREHHGRHVHHDRHVHHGHREHHGHQQGRRKTHKTKFKVIAAEGEHKASRALRHAAEVIAESPSALQVTIFVLYFWCWC